jgi:integrase
MSVGVTEDGRWYVQYRVPGIGSPKKDYFGRGDEGERLAREREEEISSGRIFTMGSVRHGRAMYLDELAQIYLDVLKAQGKTVGWLAMLRYLLNSHFLPCLCHVPVDELTFADVVQAANAFEGKSIATRNRYMDSLHAVFRFGVDKDFTSRDPMKGWKKPREPKRPMRLTVSDLSKILGASPPHLQWIIEVQWELGTRPGVSELFSLRWSDVDWERNQIRVRGTKTAGSMRLIPISDEFKTRLLEKERQAESNFIIEFRGKPIKKCHRTFKAACRKAGIDYDVRLYDIRHLFATTMLARGADLKAVSKLLGHSSTSMTADTYYHELKGEKERALAQKPMLF